MADIVSFSKEIVFGIPSAFMRTVFRCIAGRADGHSELLAFLDRQEEFDAIGGWSFDELSLDALKVVQAAVEDLATDLPGALVSWNESFRSRVPGYLREFRLRLSERMAQLE